MDFEDSPEDAEFRHEVRTWLKEHAEPRRGPDDWSRHMEREGYHLRCREWQKTMYDGGWGAITWPTEYGGRGDSPWHQMIFNQEASAFNVSVGCLAVGIGMTGPTLMAHGTEAQRKRLLRPMLTGEDLWCQLFSEPEAGSDLAALKTRAERDGDEWVVNGQKVWTSFARHAQWGILLARTDLDAPKHKGITYFLLDMSTPGVDVRPLVQSNGHAHFNEVFLTDVRIPAENVVGEVHAGWGVTHTTLANERTFLGGVTGTGPGAADLLDVARRSGLARDPVLRQDIARAWTRYQIARYLSYRVQTALSQGKQPGPEAAVTKLFSSLNYGTTGDLLMALQGAGGMLQGPEALDGGHWVFTFLSQWGGRIGGGTDEIQRNTLGERVLGLPGEPRTDKDVPFRELGKRS